MDEKTSISTRREPTEYGTVMMYTDSIRRSSRRAIRSYLVAMIFVFILNIWIFPPLWRHIAPLLGLHSDHPQHDIVQPNVNASRIPLEAHIMSKCPDARDCLVDLIVPSMEQIVDKIDFKLSFIGSMGDDDTVQCKHGPDECLGNMLSLCAQELFPHDVKRSLGFSNCMIMQYSDIPKRELVEQCSLEHGIDFQELNSCISDEGNSTDLLEASIRRSQDAGVTRSCTVRLADEIWCIRDGGEWKNCSQGHSPADLVAAVQGET